MKSVYLLNHDYLFGQSIEHDSKRFLAHYRLDIRGTVSPDRELWDGPQPAA
jgi:hypothetical protein